MAGRIDLTMSGRIMVATIHCPTLCFSLVVRLDGRIKRSNTRIHHLLSKREIILSVRSKVCLVFSNYIQIVVHNNNNNNNYLLFFWRVNI
jgi:hypothetical protein